MWLWLEAGAIIKSQRFSGKNLPETEKNHWGIDLRFLVEIVP
jgi:hypothetical protein